ncbi:tRNA cyclic N6-threonylcarbamoyladenosine(37) synthase TcdA [Photobacterium sp. WH77]|uniref:tRNA cyclic N6-threonylcarbamoyladenosine(37) synthase TcdA n=1 Tax=Photobacterium arenosum TaxID=2774143 RepID=A0ABR9BR40_9GAMM|nr:MULTISPECIES: tRNA cyclic N6-threonylcarbamoyladenosine(37) synthase TcdA [Photobacterium]MBD8514962.1 tRNA cyclic N6-threonylcarbamoyladenosine(37) synthase TcdA [Photobacterium arenosum]MBV7263752.1 tRNA cyclic N6-threonylcarbamoyladenosine(37) synthase TcdA [Photobacterium sp. WH24]MCG2838833.1 tRNA cyclic N6-threonylcarbamoyladenosine(37) synthase TcdA [Photobacterium sp. WH77]MCG2846450.1 tRNA cyclic N6-threonylcarbamoyladenosine(37) synthase TcdA [Photobacterium sp. WH80]MDO6582784.1 
MQHPDTPASDNYNQRFGGTRRLYGHQEVEILRAAHVCVIGIGGVGSWAAEALARSGIGQLTLIDMDDVCVTNINRQIHAMSGTVGRSKIEVMAERIALINPDCKVNLIDDFISPENIPEYIGSQFDYVLDAIDSVKPKAALLAFCKRNKIKVITTGGAGGQIDPTQIQIADLAKTIQDPLAAKIRNMLRRFYNFSKNPARKFGIDCVFSTEQLKYPQADGSVCEAKATAEGPKRMDCATGFGAATMVTATFGFVAVSRILQKLIEKHR